MYQKCPICNGTGIAMTIQSSNSVCPTCQGKRIISQITGLPPFSDSNTQQKITNNFGSGNTTPNTTISELTI
jgi:DnaJ-class molecular chaperone